MKKNTFRFSVFASIIFSGSIVSFAQDKFNAQTISTELIKNANAVIRSEESVLEINSISNATLTIKITTTVLNESALSESRFYGIDSKFITYKLGKVVIYDKSGKKVKDFGPVDLKPISDFSGSTLFDDVFYRYVDPEYKVYPFTAELSYTISYNGIIKLPDWIIYSDYNISTEKASFTVVTPDDYNLRFIEQEIATCTITSNKKNEKIFQWKVENIPALVKEPYSVSIERYGPAVYLAPSRFEIAGKTGNSENWENFGSFISVLNKDRNKIEGETVNKVQEITASSSDTLEMVKKLYRFMQTKTRYVSVQIGLGGWQPIEAQKVDQTSYGDCKALTNYMKSLLDLAGINSYYALIKSGSSSPDIIKDFPSNQFDHAILCVPLNKDTIWLECTNQKMPFNYLGSFTDDRDAILIKKNGGARVHTQRYSGVQNLQSRKGIVTLESSGNGKASVRTISSNYYFDDKLSLLNMDKESCKKSLIDGIEIPNFTLTDYSVNQADFNQPVISIDLSLILTKYAIMMGDRILLPLNLMNNIERLPSNTSERKMDILFRRERTLIDTIIYKIPTNYSVTSFPKPVEYSSPFGTYSAEVSVDGNEITYIRKIRYNKGTFPASLYTQLLEFNKNVSTSDNTKAILKKN